MMQPLPEVARWAARAEVKAVPDEHEVRYFAELGRSVRTETVREGVARLDARDVSPMGTPYLLIEAGDREDVGRFLVFDLAATWLNGVLDVPVPFGRVEGVEPAGPVDVDAAGAVRVLDSDGGVRAAFGSDSDARARAARFVLVAAVPLGELSDRLDLAGRRAAESARAGRPIGSKEPVAWSRRRHRQVVV